MGREASCHGERPQHAMSGVKGSGVHTNIGWWHLAWRVSDVVRCVGVAWNAIERISCNGITSTSLDTEGEESENAALFPLTPALDIPVATRGGDDQGTCDVLTQADLLRRRGADIGGWRWNRA